MDELQLQRSVAELNDLALKEYHATLMEVVTSEEGSDEFRLIRMGRLLGVLLKEPFATPNDLFVPSGHTHAYRAWTLKPAATFEDRHVQSNWQYNALEALRSDPDVVESLGWQPTSVYQLAYTAQSERGFFWFLALSSRKYLCGDPKIRSEIERQVESVQRAGVDLKNVTPEVIVGSGGLALGAALVQSVPVLGMMGAPVIAGLVVILYRIGIDAFCQWTRDHQSYHVDFPNADEESPASPA